MEPQVSEVGYGGNISFRIFEVPAGTAHYMAGILRPKVVGCCIEPLGQGWARMKVQVSKDKLEDAVSAIDTYLGNIFDDLTKHEEEIYRFLRYTVGSENDPELDPDQVTEAFRGPIADAMLHGVGSAMESVGATSDVAIPDFSSL